MVKIEEAAFPNLIVHLDRAAGFESIALKAGSTPLFRADDAHLDDIIQ